MRNNALIQNIFNLKMTSEIELRQAKIDKITRGCKYIFYDGTKCGDKWKPGEVDGRVKYPRRLCGKCKIKAGKIQRELKLIDLGRKL